MKLTAALFTALSAASFINAAPVTESALQERSYTHHSVTYDDSPSELVSYSGSWTHLTNQGYKLQHQTESYTLQANAEVVIAVAGDENTVPRSVTVYSTKKGDRGKFNVYCGISLVGTGNEYSAGKETNTGVVFSSKITKCDKPKGIPGPPYIVLKNDKGAHAFAWDAITIDYDTLN